MRDKEKLLIAYLSFFVSIVILSLILVYGMDFAYLKLRIESNKRMGYLKSKEYTEVYKYIVEDCEKTLNDFIVEQEGLCNHFGGIKNFRFQEIKQNDMQRKTGEILVRYDVDVGRIEFKKSIIEWVLVKSKMSWKVKDFIFYNNGVAIHNLKNVLDSKENLYSVSNVNINDISIFGNKIIEYFKTNMYEDIYSLFSVNLKNKGTVDEFKYYLNSVQKKYPQVKNYEIISWNVSEKGDEYKLRYALKDENNVNKIYVDIWIVNEEKFLMSGIKFIESSW